jgi:hypothetical protein
VIATPFGNVVFSCMEGNRPYFFDVYHLRAGQGRMTVRPKFLASIVGGSAFILSAVPSRRCDMSARLEDDAVVVECGASGVDVTVVVAGINIRFPDWDMPLVSDVARERSQRWWAQEWA